MSFGNQTVEAGAAQIWLKSPTIQGAGNALDDHDLAHALDLTEQWPSPDQAPRTEMRETLTDGCGRLFGTVVGI